MTRQPPFHRYRRLLRYPLRQWPTLLGIIGLSVLSSALVALEPWPMKLLVDYALGDAELPHWAANLAVGWAREKQRGPLILVAAATSLLLFLLKSSVSMGLNLAWTLAGQRMVYDLAAGLFHRMQRLSLLFHQRYPVGDSLSRLSGDSYCVYTLTSDLLVGPLQNVATLAMLGFAARELDAELAGLILAVVPLLALCVVFFGPRLKRFARQSREIDAKLLSFVHQTLSALPMVQAFGAERRNHEKYLELARTGVGIKQRGALLQRVFGFFNGFMTTAGLALVLYAGGRRVLAGALSVGGLLVFIAYAQSMLNACKSLLGTYGSLKSAEASMDRVLEVLDATESITEQPGAREMPRDPAQPAVHVRFEGVTFGYDTHPVLHEIELEAKPGEVIALVGPTGAGKSTLVSLVARLFDPWKGRVTFDGVDIREFKLASLRNQVAWVLQDPFLLPLTVAENIAYGRPTASREAIIAAATAARAHEFIERLPQGYDTVLGERGATLSGGERQRLAIARAFLKDAPVLILDEPTAALDVQTERLLLDALQRLQAGRTTFIIAHRLSTVQGAHRVVVLDQGRIVECGRPADLLALDEGRFRRLHLLQFPVADSVAMA